MRRQADEGVEAMAVTGFALADMLHKLAARGEATPPALVIDAMDEGNSIMISPDQVAGPLHTVATGLSTCVMPHPPHRPCAGYSPTSESMCGGLVVGVDGAGS